MRTSKLMAAMLMVANLVGAGAARAQGGPPRWHERDRPPTRDEAGLAPPPGTGRLRNAAQGLCLDVAGWAAQGDSNVLLWDCNDDPDQVWSFTPTGELRNALTGTVLDVAGYEGAQGSNVDVYRSENLPDQKWTLAPRGGGVFELHNLKRGLCLDVQGRAGARGDNVMLWACNANADQYWRWEPYALRRPSGPPPRPEPQRPGPPPYPTVPRRPMMPQELPPPPPPAPEPAPPPRERESRRRARPMEDEAFRALVGAVQNERYSEGQLTVIQQAATRNSFSVGQVKGLINLVAFSATKLRTLELVAPRLVDPENAFAIYDAFTFSADKEQARAILQRSGY
jgi:hypothetical protein